jgi:PAS domain S-box-containing protein
VLSLDFPALLDASPDAILAFDRDFRILYANPHALRVSHLDADGTIGKKYWDVRPEIFGTILEENLRAAMLERAPRQLEFF